MPYPPNLTLPPSKLVNACTPSAVPATVLVTALVAQSCHRHCRHRLILRPAGALKGGSSFAQMQSCPVLPLPRTLHSADQPPPHTHTCHAFSRYTMNPKTFAPVTGKPNVADELAPGDPAGAQDALSQSMRGPREKYATPLTVRQLRHYFGTVSTDSSPPGRRSHVVACALLGDHG